MSTRRHGSDPSAFEAQPSTVSDTTVPMKAPPPPALPRRPATGVMALDVAMPPSAVPPRHREGSAAIALGALMRDNGVDVDEPEERTAITSAPRPSDQPVAGEPGGATAVTTAPPQPAPSSVQYRPGSGAIALDALMREHSVRRPEPTTPVMARAASGAIPLDELMRRNGVDPSESPAVPDPFGAAATIVGTLPDGAEPSAWDAEAPTEVITLPPRRDE
jgi:hypothetical protein